MTGKMHEVKCHECGMIMAWTGREDFLSNAPMFCYECMESLARMQEALKAEAVTFPDNPDEDYKYPRHPLRNEERSRSFQWNLNIRKFWIDYRIS